MGRMYVGVFNNVAITALQDLFSLLPATDKPVALHAVYISQTSDFGDSAEEGVRISIVRGNTTVGSGGSAITGNPLYPNTAVDAATVRANDTTEASAGTEVIMHLESWNVRQTWMYHPAPEDRPGVENNEHICVRLLDAPGDSLTVDGTIVYEELI